MVEQGDDPAAMGGKAHRRCSLNQAMVNYSPISLQPGNYSRTLTDYHSGHSRFMDQLRDREIF
jgi:hypothetical protein